MTSLSSIASAASALASAAPPPGTAPDLRTRAANDSVPALTVFARQHPAQRDHLYTLMVKAGRSGDVAAVSHALKTPDYDVPVWMRYGTGGGPAYTARLASDPTNRLSNSAGWDALLKSGQVTESQQRVINRMSDNEGRLDSVQAYDSEIATLGAMQKTINSAGTGELPKQVWAFRTDNPAAYQRLFADHGWSVEHIGKGNGSADFAMRFTADGRTQTAAQTEAYIKDRAHPEHWNAALDPLLRAGRDPAFQAQQIRDFATRLDTALAVVPRGPSYASPASAYLSSEQGAALVLDQHVNRPGRVATSLGAALDSFYATNPKAARDPAQWTAAQRATYEPQIMSAYQTQRIGSGMTHPVDRYDHIVANATPLSAVPGSFATGSR